jgi:hypothetical protein
MWLTLVWLVVAALLGALALLVLDWLPALIIGSLTAIAALWVLGCVFSPAVPDRHCPRCRRQGLVKLRRGEPLGVRCELCGFEDAQRHVAYLDEW